MTTETRIHPGDADGYRAWLAERGSEEPEEPQPPLLRAPRVSVLPVDGAGSLHRRLEETADDYVLLVPPEASLYPDAFQRIAAEIARGEEPDLIYADEDAQTSDGARTSPAFKPAWDPELLLGHDYIGPVVAFRATRVRQFLAADPTLVSEAALTYELALRIASAANSIVVHIPRVLHWFPASNERPQIADSSIVAEHLRRNGWAAAVEPAGAEPSWNRIIWPLPETPPRASIVVPTRDNGEVLERCARGILDATDYPDIELLIVDNGSVDPATLRTIKGLETDERVRVLRLDMPFNFSALNNAAAREATGEVLVLLNDDTEVIDGGWLRELVSQALRPEIGMVGARLLYPDGRVQHAGIVMEHGAPWHQFKFADRDFAGPNGELALTRSVSAVTAACVAMRKAVFDEVGGMEEQLAIAFNDVDLCLRVAERGYRIICTPFAELFHHESVSRGLEDTPEKKERLGRELTWLRERWSDEARAERYANPNLHFGWNDTGEWGLELAPPQPSPPEHVHTYAAFSERARSLPSRLGWRARRMVPAALANPLFDRSWYLAQYPEVAAYRPGPYRHYRKFGVREGRDPNPLFDTRWYLTTYPDVAADDSDPLDHYLRHGAAEGRDPSPRFNTSWYLSQYPDVRATGQNPLYHYLRYGQGEGRKPRP